MAVEVGVGYVSIVPEMSRFGPELSRQMGRHEELLRSSVTDPMTQAGGDAGAGAGQGILGGIGSKLKVGMAGVAAAGAALFAKGFADALEQEKSSDRLAAQLGLSEKESARLGKVAGGVYAAGYGESIDQVNEALRGLAQNGVAAVNAPKKDLAGLSKAALSLAETFDVGVGEAARAAGQMIRTGLAKDGKQAFDLITRGFQTGADKGEDFLDTLNEYSTQFRDLGLSGAQAIGLMTQGLKAGARDADTVADALKEFAIRAKDGSDTTKEAFDAIRLNADDMAQTFAKGGPEAAKALDTVFDRLRAIKDPAERSQIAVGLFGTKAEDLQQALFSLDPSSATDALGKVGGAAQKMGDTLHDNAASRIERFKRTAMQGLVTFIGDYVLPPLERFGGVVSRFVGPAFDKVKTSVGGLFSSLGDGGGLAPFTSALSSAGTTVRDTLMPAFARFSGAVRETLLPALSKLWPIISEKLVPALGKAFSTSLQFTWGLLSKVGSILIGTVWPAAMRVYRAIAESLGPIISSVSDFIQQRAVPAVQMIGGKLGELVERTRPVISVVTGVASWLGQMAAKIAGFVIPVLVRLIGPIFSGLFSALGTAIGWLSSVVGAVVSFGRGVVTAAQAVGSGFTWLWQNVVSPAMAGIRTAISFAWSVIKPIFEVFTAVIRKSLGIAFTWLRDSVIKPVWNTISSVIATAWRDWIKPVFDTIKGFVRGTLGVAFTWLRDSVIKPVWNTIKGTISTVWRDGIKPIFDRLKSTVGTIGSSFETAKKAVAKAWDGIKDAAKRPVNFVLGTVWNEGLLRAWNAIAGWVGLDKHKLKKVKLLAAGGTVGTEPAIYNRPTAIVGEGNPAHPEFVIPTDPKYRRRALALWEAAGAQLMADGGVLGTLKGWGSAAAGAVVGGVKAIGRVVKSAADFLTDPSKAMSRIFKPILDQLAGISGGKFGKAVARVPRMAVDGIKSLVTKWLGEGGGGLGGTIPKGRRRSIILQALAAAGVPPPGTLAQWLAGMNTLITRESGWNPRAINRWDSNARAGIPSQGLAQTIPPTFNAYVPKSLRSRGILDPVANVAAAIRYIVARYGNITRVQQANANMPPKGYAGGGRPRWGEFAWVGERGPELLRFGGGGRVFDHETSMRIAAAEVGAGLLAALSRRLPAVDVAAARAYTPTPVGARQPVPDGVLRRGDTIVVRIGEREFEAVVDERVEAGFAAARRRKRAGARG